MQEENYQVAVGVAIGIIVLLIAVVFIFMLMVYANNRKKEFTTEKKNLELHFKQQLLQSQLEMQEQTFNTISREIHDNVGQVLSLAKVQINIMEQGQTLDRVLLGDVKESIGKAMADLRDIAHSLNSDRIMQSSLAEVSDHELQRINRLGIIKTELNVEGKEINIDQQRKLILLRILQESLQNIIKHAHASKVKVSYCYNADHLKLDIADNGSGFIPQQESTKKGLGLRNIYNRAELIGGKATINSIINQGTTVTITLPYA